MAKLPWFAVYVKPKHEKKVSAVLQGKGYQALLPTYTHRVRYNKTFELPLFPSYVFCRMEPQNRLPVISTPGVFSILGNGHGPEPIADDEIEGVTRLLQSASGPRPWPYVMPGQEVLVESGPFRGVRGVVTDTTDGKWLVISVNLLQRSVAVRIDPDSLSVRVEPRRLDKTVSPSAARS